MATFKVTVDKSEYTLTYTIPTTLADKAWTKMVDGDGSEMVNISIPKTVAANINILAEKDWRIAAQSAIRAAKPKSQVAAQKVLDEYRYGAKLSAPVIVEVAIVDCAVLEEAGMPLSPEQAKTLLEKGTRLKNASKELLDGIKALG